jgi:hypothetical protein
LKLDKSILEIITEPLYHVEVIVQVGRFGPDVTHDLCEDSPKVKDNAIRIGAPIIELLQKYFGDAATIVMGGTLGRC